MSKDRAVLRACWVCRAITDVNNQTNERQQNISYLSPYYLLVLYFFTLHLDRPQNDGQTKL